MQSPGCSEHAESSTCRYQPVVPKDSQGIGRGGGENIIFKQILSDYTFCVCEQFYICMWFWVWGFFVL